MSYAAIHCGLTNEMVENYDNYPSREQMAQELTEINLGYDPDKDKRFDWFKFAKRKSKDLEKYWLANKLSKNLGDISKIKKMPYADLWTTSFPCFVEGTLVFTKNGYKDITQITTDDEVLTHTNQWQKVSKIYTNTADELYKIKTMTSEDIHCTANHPFYVKKRYRKWSKALERSERLFDKPEWVAAKDLSRDYFVGTAINQKSELPQWEGIEKKNSKGSVFKENRLSEAFAKEEFWYVIGRYIGDGWIRHSGGIIICANDDELYQILPYLDTLGFGYSVVKNRKLNNIHIPFLEIGAYCLRFGRGASNKHLTADILNLPVHLLKSFLNGYIAADGTQSLNGLFKISSVSRELIYEIGQCVAKAYHRPFSVYFTQRAKTTIIEGRVVNQRDSYAIHFKLDKNIQDKAFYEDGYIWSPINDIVKEEFDGFVYNLEVENDNSYMVQNIIVHNCTDISVAGKMKGLSPDSSTRSSLLWDSINLLKTAKDNGELPKYILFENVKNLVSKKFRPDFDNLIEVLSELGFNTYWKVLNGKECGVPQNRERVFVIAIRKDIDTEKMNFPKPFDNGLRLKDILEDEVDKKYYLSDKVQERFKITDPTFTNNIVGTTKPECRTIGQRDLVYQENAIMGSLVATDYKQPKQLLQVGQLYGTENEPNPQADRVYNSDGISPTLDSCSGGNRMPKILDYQCINNKISYKHTQLPCILDDRDKGFGIKTSDYCPTQRANRNGIKCIESNYHIRKITPTEAWRLMGFEDKDVDAVKNIGISDSAMYKQAGNSIITNCVELIAEHLYKAQYDNTYVCYDETVTI